MTTKVSGSSGVEFPDASTQSKAVRRGMVGKLSRSTAQTISNGVHTLVQLNTVSADPDAICGVNRITPTVAGYYRVSGWVSLSGTGMLSAYVSLYKNGAPICRAAWPAVSAYTTSTAQPIVHATDLVYLNGTSDYVELYAFISAASDHTVNNGALSLELVREGGA